MGPDEEVIWAPQDGSQKIFLQMDCFEFMYEGTRGPGKTDALLMDFGQFVGRGFGAAWKGILFRQTYKQLTDIISKTKKWFPQIWPDAKFNHTEHYWHWPTGEQLLLRQFQKEDDYWNYHGHEYPWIGWEELCNWSNPGGYLRMQSCCRSSTKGLPRRYRSTTNPYGPGHSWVKHRFQLPAKRNSLIKDAVDAEGHPEPIRGSVHGTIYENKILLDADPDYISRLRSSARNEAELKAWLYGSWDIVAGGMFDDVWNPKYNVIKPFPVPPSWRIDRSFDWGSSKPFSVGWWAESDGADYVNAYGDVVSTVPGDLFRIGEWYGWNGKPNEGQHALAIEIAKGIVEREVRWGIRNYCKAGPADSSIYNVENGMSVAADMSKIVRLDDGSVHKGVQFTRADKRAGSRKTGWELMRKYLKMAHPQKGLPRERPGLFVVDTCDHFMRTVPVLPRDPRDPDDVDTDTEDHVGDETRYRVRAASMKITGGSTVGLY